MTCIIGYTDKENNVSWVGGDSLGSNGYTKSVEKTAKVFRNELLKNIVIGSTSTFRHIDLLKYSDELFEELDFYKKTYIDHKYMVTNFIPRIIKLFKEGVINESEINKGANFIVATPNKIFEIQTDYSVLEPELGFCSVGCGEEVAMGSLITTMNFNIPVEDKIIEALKAAEKYCCGVQRPFRLLCTNGKENIVK